MKVFQQIARMISARQNCIEANNLEWQSRHEQTLKELARDFLPHGSGVDSGCKIDLDRSTPDKLVIATAFHHMNESGMYDGWTNHNVIVTPSLAFNFHLKITGRDRNEIKEYLTDLFSEDLNQAIPQEAPQEAPEAIKPS